MRAGSLEDMTDQNVRDCIASIRTGHQSTYSATKSAVNDTSLALVENWPLLILRLPIFYQVSYVLISYQSTIYAYL